MARVADPRWNYWWALGTFGVQCVLLIILIALTATDVASTDYTDSWGVNIGPLSLASWSLLSIIIYLICFFCKKLHPLVVLTLSIELMICWLAVMIITIIGFTTNSSTYCNASSAASNVDTGSCSRNAHSYSSYYNEDYYNSTSGTYETYPESPISNRCYVDGTYYTNSTEFFQSEAYKSLLSAVQHAQKKACALNSSVVAFSILTFISYVFLVIWSAITRNRTKMPYVKAEQKPLLGQGGATPEMAQPALMHGAAASGHDEEEAAAVTAGRPGTGNSRADPDVIQ